MRAGGNPGALPLDYEWTHHVRKQWHSRLRQQQSAWEDGGKEGVYRVWVGMTREGKEMSGRRRLPRSHLSQRLIFCRSSETRGVSGHP